MTTANPDLIARLDQWWSGFEHKVNRWWLDRRVRQQEKILAEQEHRRREKMRAELQDDAWFFHDRLIGVSRRMSNLSYKYKKSERDEYAPRVKTISFTYCVMQPEAIYFQVDTTNLPNDVSVAAIRHEDTLANFSASCRKRVMFEGDEDRGYWLIIDRASTGIRGIPSHVRLDEVWAMRDKTHDGLSIPFGIGANKKLVWSSFNKFQSLLIGGATGGGKSNMIAVILCTLIRFNNPARLKLALIDLKGGVSLSAYEGLPHILRYKPLDAEYDPDDSDPPDQQDETLDAIGELIDEGDTPPDSKRPAFVDSPRRVLPLLRSLYWEGRRRLRILRRAKVRDIGTFNWRHPKRALSHIVIVFDELAELQGLSGKEQAQAQLLLAQIAALFRAAGIHCVPCTQRPTKEVITGNILGNCPARIAFSCANVTSSTLIVGNGLAAGLEPAGRAVLDYGGRQVELQTPYMPDRVVESVIAQAMAGQYEDVEVKRHDVEEDEIFRVGLEQFGGELQGRAIHLYFTNKARGIPREEVYAVIKKFLNQQIMISGTIYTVLPPQGSRPARLEVYDPEA